MRLHQQFWFHPYLMFTASPPTTKVLSFPPPASENYFQTNVFPKVLTQHFLRYDNLFTRCEPPLLFDWFLFFLVLNTPPASPQHLMDCCWPARPWTFLSTSATPSRCLSLMFLGFLEKERSSFLSFWIRYIDSNCIYKQTPKKQQKNNNQLPSPSYLSFIPKDVRGLPILSPYSEKELYKTHYSFEILHPCPRSI